MKWPIHPGGLLPRKHEPDRSGDGPARPAIGRVQARSVRANGFTLVELITILAVVAILAAVAVPRFFSRQSFEERGFYDQSVATLRYAQRVAIAERRNVFVVMEPNRIRLCYTGACDPGTAVRDPGSNNAYDINSPDGVGLDTTTTFSFNGLGQPSIAANLVVTVTGQDNRTFTVQQETGFVATP